MSWDEDERVGPSIPRCSACHPQVGDNWREVEVGDGDVGHSSLPQESLLDLFLAQSYGAPQTWKQQWPTVQHQLQIEAVSYLTSLSNASKEYQHWTSEGS